MSRSRSGANEGASKRLSIRDRWVIDIHVFNVVDHIPCIIMHFTMHVQFMLMYFRARLSVQKSHTGSPKGGDDAGSEMTAISDRRKALQQKRQRGLSQVASRRDTMMKGASETDRLNTPSPKPDEDWEKGLEKRGPQQEQDDADDDYDVLCVDHPVHVFPLDFYPPSFVDTASGKRIILAEHIIQPVLYSDGSNTGVACCDCGECSCCDAFAGMCCGTACIAVLSGLSECAGMGVNCVNWAAGIVFSGSDTGPGVMSRMLDACAEIMPGDCFAVCLGEVSACVESVTNSTTNCSTCLQTTASDTVTCLQSSYSAVVNGMPSCNQHQVIYHELNTCYQQLTSCFR